MIKNALVAGPEGPANTSIERVATVGGSFMARQRFVEHSGAESVIL